MSNGKCPSWHWHATSSLQLAYNASWTRFPMKMAMNQPKPTSLYTGLLLVGLGVILLLNNLGA